MSHLRKSIDKSLSMQEKAKNLIPGLSQLFSKRPDQFSLGVWPCYYSKAKGVEVWDLDGNKYIDMSISGIGANILGYADSDVDSAVKTAIDNGSSCSLNCPEDVELAELLCELHPWAEKVRYSRTGGEAMAIAVRIARTFTGKDKIAFCGYHGWHDWYLAANLDDNHSLNGLLMSGNIQFGVPQGLKGTALPFHYNDIQALKNLVEKNKKELAAIILEPLRNLQPHPDFLPGVRDLADKTGAVLIIDEVSAGFRMNTGGAHLLLNITPDIAVFSKALGNGYPIAAIIGKGKVMEAVQNTFVSSTNWTERIGPVAALATIKKHREFNVGEHLMKIGVEVQEGLRKMAKKHSLKIDVHGIPPLTHFTLKVENFNAVKAYFVQLMLGQGFLASNLFYAMYAHTSKHVESYFEAADRAFSEIAQALSKGEVEKRLIGKPASSGFKRLN